MARHTGLSRLRLKLKSGPKGVVPKSVHKREGRDLLDGVLQRRGGGGGGGGGGGSGIQAGGQLGERGLVTRRQRLPGGGDDVDVGQVAAGDRGGTTAERHDDGADVLQGA